MRCRYITKCIQPDMESITRNPEPGTQNTEPGTRNSAEPGTLNTEHRTRQLGFSIAAAIFLLVVLALLGAIIVTVTGVQQASEQLDVQGVRAYHAARAGIEWGAYQVLDPNNASATPPDCPATTNITGLAASLSAFTISVTCVHAPATEGNRSVRVYQVTAAACNQPNAGTNDCPSTAPTTGYVERKLQATFSKCKDSTAAGPRFACG